MRTKSLSCLSGVLLLFAVVISNQAQTGSTATSATPTDECGCDPALPDPLAVVNGVKISIGDLGNVRASTINELRQQVVDARKRELDLQINSILLQAEAKRRGMTTVQLLEFEVVAKVTTPSEADAQTFFNQNQARLGSASFASVKDNIVEYLRAQRQEALATVFAQELRAKAVIKLTNVGASPPAVSQSARARVLATVNGRNITAGDIEDGLLPLVASVQEQLYNLRKSELDVKINDLLLDAEAKKKAVRAAAILDTIKAGAAKVTDVEAEKFYQENKSRINGEFTAVKPQIVTYLKEKAQHDALETFVQQLRSAATVQVFLKPPTPPVYTIAIDDQPVRGAATAKVTVVTFTDYECPTCAVAHEVLDRLFREYGSTVRFVMRDYPLSQHKNALKAAEAAEAAREQGKFWEYSALLQRNQNALQVEQLKEYATSLGLVRATFDEALATSKFRAKVERDQEDGSRIGVSGVPATFVNGTPVANNSYEAVKTAIEEALKARKP